VNTGGQDVLSGQKSVDTLEERVQYAVDKQGYLIHKCWISEELLKSICMQKKEVNFKFIFSLMSYNFLALLVVEHVFLAERQCLGEFRLESIRLKK
jgi:hypothetical protein